MGGRQLGANRDELHYSVNCQIEQYYFGSGGSDIQCSTYMIQICLKVLDTSPPQNKCPMKRIN